MAGLIEQLLRLTARTDVKDLDKTVRGLDQIDRAAKQTEGGFQRLAKSGAAFGVGLAGLNSALELTKTAISASIGQAATFEQRLAVLRVQSKATAEQVQAISERAKQLGNDLTLPGVSASNAAEAMLALSKAGLNIRDTMNAARGSLQLAKTENLGFAQAAEITANTLNAFKLRGDEATRVADLLAGGASSASGGVLEMGQALTQAASIAQGANQTVEDTVTALSLMAKAGIQGSDAGTSLKTALLALQAPTKEAAGEMAKYGINVRDANGNMLPMRALIEQMTARLGGLSSAQRDAALKTIFGNDAIRAGLNIFTAGTQAYDDMARGVTRAGAAQELAAAQATGLKGAIAGLQSQVETMALTAGQKATPALTAFVNAISQGLSSEQLATIGIGLSSIGQFIAAMAEGFGRMPPVVQKFTTLMAAATAAVVTFNVVAAANPLVAAIVVITAAAAATAYLTGELRKQLDQTIETNAAMSEFQRTLAGLSQQILPSYQARLSEITRTGGTTRDQAEYLRAEHERLGKTTLDLSVRLGEMARALGMTWPEAEKNNKEFAKLYNQWLSNQAAAKTLEDLVEGLGLKFELLHDGTTILAGDLSKLPDAAKKAGADVPKELDPIQKMLEEIFKDGREVQKLIRDIVSPPTGTEAVLVGQLASIDAGLKGAGAAARTSGDEKAYWIAKARELFAAAGLEIGVLEQVNTVLDRVAKGNLSAADANKVLTDILDASIKKKEAVVDAESATRDAVGKTAEAQLGLGESLDTVIQKTRDSVDVYRGVPEALGKVGDAAATVGPQLQDILSPAFVADLEKRAKAVGLSVPAGLAAGIQEGKDDAINAALDLAAAVERASREGLRAESPSKVFIQIGEDVVEGLLVAWQRSEGVVTHALVSLLDGGIRVVEASAVRLVETYRGTISTLADGIAETARAGQSLRAMQQEITRLDTALAILNRDLAFAEPYSDYRAELERQIQILNAWRGQVQASIGVLQAQRAELDATRTALDGYEQAYRDAVTGGIRNQQFGIGAPLITLLTGDLSDPATGAAISGAVEALIKQLLASGAPFAVETGNELRRLIYAALANPADPQAVQNAINAVLAVVGQVRKATVFSLANLRTELAAALNLQGLVQVAGTEGARLIGELANGLKEGGVITTATVASISAGILGELAKLPPEIGGPLAEEFRQALEDYAANPTQEGLDKIEAILRRIGPILQTIPDNLKKLAPEVQAAIKELTRQYDLGQIGPEEYAEKVRTISEVIPRDLKELDAAARETIASLTQAYLAGTIGPEMYAASVEFAVEASRKRLEEVRRNAEAAKAEMEAARRWFEQHGFDKPYDPTATAAPGGPGGGGVADADTPIDPFSIIAAYNARLRRGIAAAPRFAGGLEMGPVRRPTILMDQGTGAIVGRMAEQGPEWIANRAQVEALAASRRGSAAGMGGVTLNIPISGNFLMNQEAGTQLAMQLIPAINQGLGMLREGRTGAVPLGAR